MANYQNGKIYAIYNSENDIKYIGSTVRTLEKRMIDHRHCAKTRNTKFYTAMKEIGVDNFQIMLLKNFPCQSKSELESEEFKLMKRVQKKFELYNDFIGTMSTEQKQKLSVNSAKPHLGKFQEEHNSFNFGCISFRKINNSWRFQWMENGSKKTKSFSVAKYGNYIAKFLAEAERKNKYPKWKSIEDLVINELCNIEI